MQEQNWVFLAKCKTIFVPIPTFSVMVFPLDNVLKLVMTEYSLSTQSESFFVSDGNWGFKMLGLLLIFLLKNRNPDPSET